MTLEDMKKERRERRVKLARNAGIAALVIALIAGVFAVIFLPDWDSTSPEETPTAATTTTTTTTTTAPATTSVKPVVATTCTYGKPLKYEPRSGVGDVVRPNDDAQYKFEDKQGVIDAAAEDPMVLAAYAHEFMRKTYPDGRNWKSLVNEQGNCLNEQGNVALERLKLFVTEASMKIGEADSSWTNTGGSDEGIVSNTTGGITGDRKAMIFEYNGEKVVILLRCGNPVHEAPRYPQKYVPPPSGGGTPPPKTTTRTTVPPTRTTTKTTTPPTRTTTITTTTPPTTTTTLEPKPTTITPSGTQGAGPNENQNEGESTDYDPPTITTSRTDEPEPEPQPDPESTPDPEPTPTPEVGVGEEAAELPGTVIIEEETVVFDGDEGEI